MGNLYRPDGVCSNVTLGIQLDCFLVCNCKLYVLSEAAAARDGTHTLVELLSRVVAPRGCKLLLCVGVTARQHNIQEQMTEQFKPSLTARLPFSSLDQVSVEILDVLLAKCFFQKTSTSY